MLLWIMKVSIISVVFILVVHNILHFLTDTLTIPKIKDLVNAPHEKYQDIYKTINQKPTSLPNKDNAPIQGTTEINSIPSIPTENLLPKVDPKTNLDMKNELKNFMKKQLNQNDNKSELPEYMSLG